MRAILGPLVYILIRPIGRKAIKKIESAKSAKSVMLFFYNYGLFLFPILFLLSIIVLYT